MACGQRKKRQRKRKVVVVIFNFLLQAAVCTLLAKAGAIAASTNQDGILRDDHGKVHKMNQPDAIKACAKNGMHLPSIRELEKLNYAAGVILKEPIEVTEEEIHTFSLAAVSSIDPNGKTDKFYLSYKNYIRPSGDLGENWFWSSSVSQFYSDAGYTHSGAFGQVGLVLLSFDTGAVRCVVGQ